MLPVAPVADKAGTFVTWEGRPRPFEAVFSNPGSLPDLRVLAGIADELGAGQLAGLPHGRRGARRDGGDGPVGRRPPRARSSARSRASRSAKAGALVLASWKLLLDQGSMQDGDAAPRAPRRRPAVARVSQAAYDALFGMLEGAVRRRPHR